MSLWSHVCRAVLFHPLCSIISQQGPLRSGASCLSDVVDSESIYFVVFLCFLCFHHVWVGHVVKKVYCCCCCCLFSVDPSLQTVFYCENWRDPLCRSTVWLQVWLLTDRSRASSYFWDPGGIMNIVENQQSLSCSNDGDWGLWHSTSTSTSTSVY